VNTNFPSGFFLHKIPLDELQVFHKELESSFTPEEWKSVSINFDASIVRRNAYIYPPVGFEGKSKHIKSMFKKFAPKEYVEDSSYLMYQKYNAGFRLGQHADCQKGEYNKIVIVNLYGKADFYLTKTEEINKDSFKVTVKPGDVVIMEGDAIKMMHGLPLMPEDRSNLVMRYASRLILDEELGLNYR